MSQPSLFDAPAERGASRGSDPATSREAGRSMSGQVLRDQQALVLGSVSASGSTAWQVTCDLLRRGHTVQQNVVAKRLGELRDLGMVRLTGETRPGSSSRHLQVFALTDAGRAVA